MRTDWQTMRGLQVFTPRHFIYTIIADDIKVSKWSKRRDGIIFKMKKKKSTLNIALKALFNLLLSSAATILWVYFLSIFQSPELAALIGITIPTTWIFIYLISGSIFEIDTDSIKVKHRGRVL